MNNAQITTEQVLTTAEFLNLALPEAIKHISKTTGVPVEVLVQRFNDDVEFQATVAKYLIEAAKQTAAMMNERN